MLLSSFANVQRSSVTIKLYKFEECGYCINREYDPFQCLDCENAENFEPEEPEEPEEEEDDDYEEMDYADFIELCKDMQ